MKKLSFLTALSVFAVSVSACVSPTVNNNPANVSNKKVVNLTTVEANATASNKAEEINYVVDMGKALKTNKPGGSFTVKIDPPKDAFNTKASTDGRNNLSVQSLRINLCTVANQPFTSRLGATNGFVLARAGAGPHTVTFTNVPAGGPYFATVAAFDVVSGSVPAVATATEGFVAVDNGGTAYAAPDTGARLAVSTNSVTVNANLTLTPAAQVLSIPTNIQVTGANVDATVTTSNVGVVALGAV